MMIVQAKWEEILYDKDSQRISVRYDLVTCKLLPAQFLCVTGIIYDRLPQTHACTSYPQKRTGAVYDVFQQLVELFPLLFMPATLKPLVARALSRRSVIMTMKVQRIEPLFAPTHQFATRHSSLGLGSKPCVRSVSGFWQMRLSKQTGPLVSTTTVDLL